MKRAVLLPLFARTKRVVMVGLVFQSMALYMPVRAQVVASISQAGTEIILKNDTAVQMRSFDGKYMNGKVYLRWVVARQTSDGIYVVYRSFNGVDYEFLGYKNGIGVPTPCDIAYFFVDELPGPEYMYYKFIHVGNNKKFQSSEKIIVSADGVSLSHNANREQ